MSVSQVTCPECDKVLRPAKPLAVGKKVKCPQCGATFPVTEPKTAPVRQAKAAPAKKPAAKPTAKPAAPKKDDEEDEGPAIYRFVDDGIGAPKKEDDEDDEDKKPDISYAPDMSIKDLRGPAQAAVMKPTNWMIFIGIMGFLGWMAFLVIIYIPVLFPLTDDKPQPAFQVEHGFGEASSGMGGMMMPNMPGMGGPQGGQKQEMPPDPKQDKSFFELAGIDFSAMADFSTMYLILYTIPIILALVFAATLTFGAVKAQNLESREWGIASSILSMIPINVAGCILVFSLFAQLLLNMLMDDEDFVNYVLIFFAVVAALAGIGIGIWNLMTFMQPEVIDGFEYVAE